MSIFFLVAHYFSGAGLKRSNVGWKWKCIPHPLSIVRDLFSAVFKMLPSVVQVVHRQCSRIYFHNCEGKFRSPDKISCAAGTFIFCVCACCYIQHCVRILPLMWWYIYAEPWFIIRYIFVFILFVIFPSLPHYIFLFN